MMGMTPKGLDCVEICGDGIRITQEHQCDDGNNRDGDGCSSICQNEPDWVCDGSSEISSDVCHSTLLLYPIFNVMEDHDDESYHHEKTFSISFNRNISQPHVTISKVRLRILALEPEEYDWTIAHHPTM
jgi:cysteine-rich repeat protein